MARYGITYEEVAKAASTMIQQRQNPTVEKVRTSLGSTGSFATISKHLSTWRKQYFENQTNPSVVEEVVAPQEVSTVITSAWEQLNNQAKQQIEKIKQEYDEKLVVILQEKEQLQQVHDEAKSALEKERTQVNHLETDLKLKNKELIELRQQTATLEAELKSKNESFAALQSETRLLVTELQQIQAEFIRRTEEHQQQQRKSYEKDVQAWKALVENQRTEFMVKHAEVKTAKEKLEKINTELETKLQQQAIRYKDLQEQTRGLETDLSVIRQQKEEAEKQAITYKTECNHKENLINFYKDICGSWKEAIKERKTEAHNKKEIKAKR